MKLRPHKRRQQHEVHVMRPCCRLQIETVSPRPQLPVQVGLHFQHRFEFRATLQENATLAGAVVRWYIVDLPGFSRFSPPAVRGEEIFPTDQAFWIRVAYAGPTIAHGCRCASISASAQRGSGKQ